MKRDRMKLVLQAREGVERQRLAEQAVADIQLRLASRSHGDAVAVRDRHAVPERVRTAEDLHQHRVGMLALNDAVERARERERAARQESEVAEQRRIEAAIARRSA
ncbi:MAG: hypothetical protein WD378_01110, partial [Egicoccus sp.]